MRTVIYYFTGTGNSLAVAKKIARGLGETGLVPIASLQHAPGVITPDAERVGIACPVYFAGLPLMVAEFAGRLDCSDNRYTFAVVTLGGSGGGTALRQLDGLLRKQHGRGLDAGFEVKMPGNYIFMYGSPTGEKQAGILASADARIAEILPLIERCEHRNLPRPIFGRLLFAIGYPHFTARARNRDREFFASDACTACGSCVDACPAGDIELVEGRPVWKGALRGMLCLHTHMPGSGNPGRFPHCIKAEIPEPVRQCRGTGGATENCVPELVTRRSLGSRKMTRIQRKRYLSRVISVM